MQRLLFGDVVMLAKDSVDVLLVFHDHLERAHGGAKKQWQTWRREGSEQRKLVLELRRTRGLMFLGYEN